MSALRALARAGARPADLSLASLAAYDEWLRDPDAFVLVAEQDGSPVGYALITIGEGPVEWRVGERVADGETLSVLSDARGEGVGTLLSSPTASPGRTGPRLHHAGGSPRHLDAYRLGVSSSRTEAEPRSFLHHDLEAAKFTGWRTWDELRSSEFADTPSKPGAYLVFRASTADPVFIHPSTGGWFKGQDPSESIERLKDEWVPGAHVVYIGKADYRSRRRPIEALRRRLWEFARFGAGERIGHRGGRLIWQLADSPELLVAWREVSWDETARDYEKRLLHRFADLHGGRRPFANLTG